MLFFGVEYAVIKIGMQNTWLHAIGDAVGMIVLLVLFFRMATAPLIESFGAREGDTHGSPTWLPTRKSCR